MLIPLIGPRKLVLIKGSERETEILASECRDILADGTVMAPREGESVDAGVDTHAWECRLSRALVSRLRWQDVKGLGVVALSGLLSADIREKEVDEGPGAAKKMKISLTQSPEEISKEIPLPVLDIVPNWGGERERYRATQPVHVGDLRLADLRRSMQNLGHRAMFFGEGTLVVDECVVVRKGMMGGLIGRMDGELD
jgi:cleavage and polyadenylation specificity factor subunit 2